MSDMPCHFLDTMFFPQYLRRTLANNDAWSHCVTSCHARHNRSVSDAEIIDAVDPESAVDNRQRILPHLCGAGLVPVGHCGITNEVFEFCALQVPGHGFALNQRFK